MIVDFENVGYNPELISSLLFQIYLMGRYKNTGEDMIIIKPDEPVEELVSFNDDFNNDFG